MKEGKKGQVGRFWWDPALLFSLGVVFLAPSFLFVALDQSSLAVGVLAASVMVVILNSRYFLNLHFSGPVFFIVFLALLMSLSAFFSLLVSHETKPIMSLVLVFVFIAAVVLGRRIHEMEYKEILDTVYLLIIFLLVLGWLALVWPPNILGYAALEKPVFPYSEESHYALAVGMLACGQVYVDKAGRSLFVLANMLLLAMLFPNLTLLVFFILGSFLFSMRFKPIVFWSILLLGMLFLVFVYYLVLPHFEYFSSRLNFSGYENLTTLVFFQGWGMAWINLIDTHGIGLGFQMLGEPGTAYPHFTDRIMELTSREFNTSDGGLLAAKLIAEMGLLGVVLVAIYFVLVLRFMTLGNAWHNNADALPAAEHRDSKKRLMLLGFMIGFFVEVFLRGYGYFSPGVFFLVTILYALNRMRARRQYEHAG